MRSETRRRVGWAGPAAVALALVAAAPAHAGTITVTTTVDQNDGVAPCSLREAVGFANNDTTPGGCTDTDNTTADLIQLSAGDHNLTFPGVEDANASGDLDVTEEVTIQGVGSGATGIDGTDLDRVLDATPGTAIILSGFTVHDGSAGSDGGGLRLGNATLTDVTVVDNATTTAGGGIAAGPVVSLIDSTVTDNTAAVSGGGVVAPTVNLTRSTVISNSSGGPGGGISGNGTIIDSTVSGNRTTGSAAAGFGGGIRTTLGDLTVLRSTIAGNTATTGADGGGVHFASPGTFSLINSTVSGNGATEHGGGIASSMGTTDIANATITGNSSDTNLGTIGDGGGIRVAPAGAVLNLRNTIVAGNTALSVNTSEDCSGTVNSQGYNLFGDPTGCTIVGVTTGNIVNPAPGLGPLANNGGPTATHALLGGSPALNAGYPGSGAGMPCEPTDQRGQSRGGGAGTCDIGAFEVQGTAVPPGSTPTITPPTTTAAPPPSSSAKRCKKGRKLKKGKCVKKKRRK